LSICATSIFAQRRTDWEWILIDDGSNDGSVELCQGFHQADNRVNLYSTRGREGAAVARNIGISKARGRYIAFLDCDDLWMPEKLEQQINFMVKNRLAFSWTSYEVINESGIRTRTQYAPQHCSYEDLLTKRAVIGCLTAVYDRTMLGLQFMPRIRMRQDFGLWLKLLRVSEVSGLSVAGLTEPLAQYRVHGEGMTSNKIQAAWYQWRLYRDIERLSLLKSTACFASYFMRGIGNRFVK
jgi:glycosyltransferase involved in cell wall biosynthesis